uniref:Adenylate kinase isoenzyme 6 homolog n=1 Tax=Albugo laibachii Nc14 TaxID=890382 RepID=F0WQB5_9STRA|nr:adenylate kinase putative [Albugo laibachii Nc14]|eukprot:CCA23523.1 adenylate kinase putative [Albugo laibachii Nc14]
MVRTRPNILVTGTPGTGKSSLCHELSERSGFRHINVGELIKERHLFSERDEAYDCLILDEDKVLDEMEEMLAEGGQIVDFHSCDFFPERYFDLVVVLQVSNTILYDRLKARKYNEKKLQENVECEIMQVVLQEAMESYPTEIVQALENETITCMEQNLERILHWICLYAQQATLIEG